MPKHQNYDLTFRPSAFWTSDEELAARGVMMEDGIRGVEIARVRFRVGDPAEVPIYAYIAGDRYQYQIGTAAHRLYGRLPTASAEPITFGGLLDLIQDCIHPDDLRHFQCKGKNIANLHNFVSVRSEFYPQLATWFEEEDSDYRFSRAAFSFTKIVTYSLVAFAAFLFFPEITTARHLNRVDVFALVFFFYPVLSLLWSTDLKTGFKRVCQWALVGCAALILSRGMTLAQIASMACIVSGYHLLIGLALDLKHQAYRPLGRYRLRGIGHPNYQAAYAAIFLACSNCLMHVGSLDLIAWILLCGVVTAALILTRSRTAWWAVAAMLIVSLGLELWHGFAPFSALNLLFLAAMTLALTGATELFGRRYTDAGGNLSHWVAALGGNFVHLDRDEVTRSGGGGRFTLWRYLLEAIRRRPVLGYGFGYWSPARQDESLRRLAWRPGSAHSIYLETVLGIGVPGLMMLLLLFGYSALAVFSLSPHESLLIGALIVFVGTQGLYESMFYSPNFLSLSFYLILLQVLSNAT